MPLGNDPVNPTGQPSPQPSTQMTQDQLAQLAQQLGMDPSALGSSAGTTIDAGLPSGFVQQVDLALRRKLGARYSELTQDQINGIAQQLWDQTNGVVKQYYQQNPFPTSNQSLINQYLFSPSSPLPDLARNTIAMLPANEMTAADRRFLTSAGGTTSMLQLAEMAGFRGDAATTIAAIAMAESGGNPNALNRQSGATGILQFMPSTWQGLVSQGRASGDPNDPLSAFQAAYELSQHGTNFSDWETFTTGAYQQFMDPSLLGLPLAGYSQTAGDLSQHVPFPFNPIFAGDVTESHAEGDPGIDYGMPVGQPIVSPVAGVVTVKTYAPGHGMENASTQGWGRAVFIRTQGGYTFYVGHLGPGVQVANGQFIQPGQILGVSGGDVNDPEGLGGYSSGPHVELGWIDPQGNFTDPTALLDSIFSGTTYSQLQSQFPSAGNLLGTGVATTSAQQQQLMGYDSLLESIYQPIASALEQYLGRRPLASEIRQVAQLGLNSDQLKSYMNSLPSHIQGLSYGTYTLLQQQGDTEFRKLFGYPIPDSMVKELFDKSIVTPSAISLYLAQHPLNGISQDPVGMNHAYAAASPWMQGVWNDQAHPTDLENLYKMAQQRGYTPPASNIGEQLAPDASPSVQKTIGDTAAGVF